MTGLTRINLHDSLGDFIGRKTWELKVSSVPEAIRAINTMTNGKLFRYLSDEQNKNQEYEVLVNNKTLIPPNRESVVDDLDKSEFALQYDNLESIDIVPSISGSDKNILGIVLIVVAVALIATGVGAAAGAGWATGITGTLGVGSTSLIVAGLGLAASGAMILLSKPPKFEPFGNIDQGQRDSYLFNGPVNTVSEGGPVPIGYGELIVGSNVIAQNLQVRDYILRDENDPNSTNSGIIIVDKESQYDWAVNYINSEEYESDKTYYNYIIQEQKRTGRISQIRFQARPEYQRLYWSKYFIYWYQVQNQITSFLSPSALDQYSASIQN